MTTWVLLRGLARESRHWGAFLPALRSAVPKRDVVLALDLPGNGRRYGEASPASVKGLMEAARADLRAKRHDGPVILLALSLGGMVALQWAADHPREVAGCILVNSSVRGLSPAWQRLRPRALLHLVALARPGLDAAARERRILRLTSNLPVRDTVAAEWAAHARAAPVSRRNLARQLLAAARFRFRQPPPVPVLLLASQHDRIVSVQCSRAMARAWSVPLHEHSGAGHDLALDDPEWLVTRVLAWGRDVTQPP